MTTVRHVPNGSVPRGIFIDREVLRLHSTFPPAVRRHRQRQAYRPPSFVAWLRALIHRVLNAPGRSA
jgi:hypothetical protein